MLIKLDNVRLSFPRIWTAEQVQGQGKPKFSASFILAPTSPGAKALADAVDAVSKEKWAAKAPAILKELRKGDRVCYRTEEKTNSEGEVLDGYAGMHYVNASTDTRPLIIDRDKTPLQEVDGRPYGGCYVNAMVDVWAMDNQFGKRVCATLKGLQFIRDGDAFSGGRQATPDDFSSLETDDLSA